MLIKKSKNFSEILFRAANIVVASFIIAFILAFAVGANDVANSFGTTVGSKTISMKTACVLAIIFESCGAVFLGANVGETIRKHIFDISVFEGKRNELLVGMLSVMIGSVMWQMFATFLRLPVSGTHAIETVIISFFRNFKVHKNERLFNFYFCQKCNNKFFFNQNTRFIIQTGS